MAFTYDLNEDLGKLRLQIGDSILDVGPRPGQANFSDAELTATLTEEGTVEAAAAHMFEILAREWSSQPAEVEIGPRTEIYRGVVDNFQDMATNLREAIAGTTADAAYAVPLERTDAYADAADE